MSADLPATDVPVTSVAGAIARMEAIEAALPAADGLACFNRMYLDVTTQVNSRLGQGFFTDPVFMAQLDVTFANLYFAAADNASAPATVPLAWRPLVEQRAAAGIEPHFADYQKVDQLLDAAEQSIRQSFESAPELAVDRHLSAVNTLVANWTITSARDLAWDNCLLLWSVRDDPIARALFLDTLAASTALASRLLLVAV